mgnify:CR=1 FL=1
MRKDLVKVYVESVKQIFEVTALQLRSTYFKNICLSPPWVAIGGTLFKKDQTNYRLFYYIHQKDVDGNKLFTDDLVWYTIQNEKKTKKILCRVVYDYRHACYCLRGDVRHKKKTLYTFTEILHKENAVTFKKLELVESIFTYKNKEELNNESLEVL